MDVRKRSGRGHGCGVRLAVCDLNDRHGPPLATLVRTRRLAIR